MEVLSDVRTKLCGVAQECGVEETKLTISRSSRAVSRASSSRDAFCAFARASFISSESGLPRIASMTPGSRSVLRVVDCGGGDAATSLSVVSVVEFSMLHRRRLCMFRLAFRGGRNTERGVNLS